MARNVVTIISRLGARVEKDSKYNAQLHALRGDPHYREIQEWRDSLPEPVRDPYTIAPVLLEVLRDDPAQLELKMVLAELGRRGAAKR